MSRYRAREVAGLWAVFDRRTGEVLRSRDDGAAWAEALADLLNSLETQQDWRDEAGLWPAAA